MRSLPLASRSTLLPRWRAMLCLLCVLVPPYAAAQAAPSIPGLAAADSMAAAEFARDSAASITVGVVSAGELIWTRSFGFADVRTRRPADRNTVYRIGSITKPFTAVMLLQLMEAGTLRLSDPVARFFPEIGSIGGAGAGDPPVTFHHLALMTSGLPREPREEGPFWTGPVSRWQATLLDALPHTSFAAVPGTRFEYSNLGYAVLGAALERAAGVPYVQWQRERILEPLGMHHTAFDVDPAMARVLATGYEIGDDGAPDETVPARELREGRGYKVPNGALFTTVDDLARFVSFQLGHGPEAVLPHAALDRAFGGTVATSADLDMGYGLGFMVMRRGDFTWLGHNGGVAGYTAMMYFDREHQLGVIVLRNATGGRARIGRLAPDMLRTLIDARLAAARPAGGGG
jgi:CubicO group peptidase (beta-lactamase class C family)